jgi:hypothetical protein
MMPFQGTVQKGIAEDVDPRRTGQNGYDAVGAIAVSRLLCTEMLVSEDWNPKSPPFGGL